MTINKIFLTLLFLSLIAQAIAQNKVITTDGFVYQSVDNKIDTLGFVQIIKKNGKIKYIDTAEIFALISDNDTAFLYYSTDYPLENAKYFMQGQIDGRKYKNKMVNIGAFAVGAGAPILITYANFSAFYSPLFSVGYIASFSKVNTNNPKLNIPDNMRNNQDYIRGYKLSAGRTKIKNMSIYSVAGLVTGFGILWAIGK
jgi:hypothetical protein